MNWANRLLPTLNPPAAVVLHNSQIYSKVHEFFFFFPGPIPPSDEGVGVITPTQPEFKSKSKIVIQVDASFIDDSRNGALDLQGIIIGDAAGETTTMMIV